MSFHLESFREDLRRSNISTLFTVCSADLDIICCGSFSRFIHHFQRNHNYAPCLPPPPPPHHVFHYHCFQFFSPFNTVVPREIEDNDYGTFQGVNKILYALGKIVNSFISMHKISTPLRVVCVNGKHLSASKDCLLSICNTTDALIRHNNNSGSIDDLSLAWPSKTTDTIEKKFTNNEH